MDDVPKIENVKDYAYYARRAQELAESEKAFVTKVSWNVDGYWSSVYEDEGNFGRNFDLWIEINILFNDNKGLNAKIHSLHNLIGVLEAN